MTTPEFHLFLPQMRLSIEAIVARAQAAEAAGFTGIALMDHLTPPSAEDQPMYEAMTTAAWLLARTSRLTVGHLVLCDAMRHPAVLAKEAVTLDHASGGRFELGIGWGSVPDELVTFGVADPAPKARVSRLAESLSLLRALWAGELVDHEGRWFTCRNARQQPTPLGRIPIVIGGAGPKTLALVAHHADWWNLPISEIHRVDELRPQAGSARVSIQHMVTFIPSEDRRDAITSVAQRRFGHAGDANVIGSGPEFVEHFRRLHAQGIDRFYLWLTDFAPPEILAALGAELIAPLTAAA